METMPNVQELMNDAVLALNENGILPQIVQKQIEKTLQHIINDVFGSFSEFSKTVEKAVHSALEINIDSLDLPGYNTW
ncbi:hypothetical protein [Alicyclobacillus sp. SO9]|uniref:hypothetical protein n=1 Tax=Alicyclobacillus sp. SO9 TaxID=2665646 RepID=UPI0018E6F325|nr:hypothetical protein [Alicyclobacillus sp. SO9]QQE79639.1 hypothetical protein GI364_03870 [Alicyclobacillus sp. SO9]